MMMHELMTMAVAAAVAAATSRGSARPSCGERGPTTARSRRPPVGSPCGTMAIPAPGVPEAPGDAPRPARLEDLPEPKPPEPSRPTPGGSP